MFALLVILRSAQIDKCLILDTTVCDCIDIISVETSHRRKMWKLGAPESTVKRDYTYCTQTHTFTLRNTPMSSILFTQASVDKWKSFSIQNRHTTQLM